MEIEVKKTTGFEGYVPQKVVQTTPSITAGQNHFEGLLVKYEKLLHGFHEWMPSFVDVKHIKRLGGIDEVLSPPEINSFLQVTSKHGEHDYFDDLTGLFTSALMCNAQEQRYRNFLLNVEELPLINHMCSYLKGPMDLELQGSVGSHFGYQSQHITAKVAGNVGFESLVSGKYSTVEIYGDAGEDLALGVERMKLKVYGKVENGCGKEAEHSDIKVVESAGAFGNLAQDSNFTCVGYAFSGGAGVERCDFKIGSSRNLGAGAKRSRFVVEDVGKLGFNAENCDFDVKGTIGKVNNPKGCTFYIRDKEQLPALAGNKIVVVKDGH
jgi:hypothetical protein